MPRGGGGRLVVVVIVVVVVVVVAAEGAPQRHYALLKFTVRMIGGNVGGVGGEFRANKPQSVGNSKMSPLVELRRPQ